MFTRAFDWDRLEMPCLFDYFLIQLYHYRVEIHYSDDIVIPFQSLQDTLSNRIIRVRNTNKRFFIELYIYYIYHLLAH